MGQATLVKWPDMMQPAVAKGQGGIGEVKLSPKARVSQLGIPAFKQFLENLPLAALRPWDEPFVPPNKKCFVLHVEPGEFGELGHAILDNVIAAQNSEGPQLAYLGLCQNYAENLPTDSPDIGNHPADGNVVATTVPLGRVFAGRLLSEWWETHPSAGPPEGLANLTGPPLGKPPLRVCTWQGDVPVVMPEAAGKFAPGTEAADQWQGEVTAFEEKHGRVTVATVDEQSGPDFESEGLTRPRDTSAVVAVHPRTDELVPVARAHARFDPVEIFLEKDTGDLYLAATVDAPEDDFVVGPCELFGFGLGSFETKPVGEAREALLPCLLEDDCAMIIRTPDGPGGGAPDDGQQKSVMPLATAIFQCERHGWGPKRGGAGALPRPQWRVFPQVQRAYGGE